MAENAPTPQQPSDPGKTTRQPEASERPDQPESPLVESPSATTSSERNKSGNAAWIIVGAVLLVLVLLANGIAGCTSAIMTNALQNSLSGQDGTIPDYLGYDGSGSELGSGAGTLGSDSSTSTGLSASSTYTTDQALALLKEGNISADGLSIDAGSTSGSQQAVVDYAKGLVDIDSRHTTEMRKHLRAATGAGESDPETRASELAAASSEASAAKTEIETLSQPADSALSGSGASDISADLSSAKTSLSNRWDDIAKVVDMTTNPKQLTVQDLSDEDNLIYSDTSDAVYYLESALASSVSK